MKTDIVRLPAKPTLAMRVAGARSIGNSMMTPNHLERAAKCYEAMLEAYLTGKIEDKPL